MPSLLKLRLDKIMFRKLTDGTRQYEAFSKAQSEARIKQGTTYVIIALKCVVEGFLCGS